MFDKILTVSIAAYNAEKDIARCLDSMINSSVLDFLDIIVVNDGSSDRTKDIASEYANKYPNSVRVINKANGGHGSTINVGIVEAKGKYFKIVDSDDWVDKNGIERLVDYLMKSDIDLVINPYDIISSKDFSLKTHVEPCSDPSYKNKIVSVNKLSGNEDLHMHAMTFKTEIIKKVGPVIDEKVFYVDMEYCIYPLLYVNTLSYLDFSVYQYLFGNQTQSCSMMSYIKRRREHEFVILSLIKFYSTKLFSSQKIKSIVYRRICEAITGHCIIYVNMGNRTAKNELKEFMNLLKENEFIYTDFQKSSWRRLFIGCLLNSNYIEFKILTYVYLLYKTLKREN